MPDEEELLVRAKKILRELRLRRPTMLQQWMAHYIAECIERLESGTREGAQSIADRCAETIARLWEMQIQIQTNAVERGVNYYIKQTDLDENATEALRLALDKPDSVDAGVAPLAGITVWQLGEVERLALEVLWAAARRKRPPERADGVAEAFAEARDRASTRAQQTVGAIFPLLRSVSLDNYEEVRRVVADVLRAVDRLRRRLIWDEDRQLTGRSDVEQPE